MLQHYIYIYEVLLLKGAEGAKVSRALTRTHTGRNVTTPLPGAIPHEEEGGLALTYKLSPVQ